MNRGNFNMNIHFLQGEIDYFAILFFLFLIPLMITPIVKFTWTFLVKRIFPGAVEKNLITKNISWVVSFIISIILVFIAG